MTDHTGGTDPGDEQYVRAALGRVFPPLPDPDAWDDTIAAARAETSLADIGYEPTPDDVLTGTYDLAGPWHHTWEPSSTDTLSTGALGVSDPDTGGDADHHEPIAWTATEHQHGQHHQPDLPSHHDQHHDAAFTQPPDDHHDATNNPDSEYP